MLRRYITIPAIQLEDNRILPIWDDNLKYEKHELYGKRMVTEDGVYSNHLIEVILDLKTREISRGVVVDIYPDDDKLDYKIKEGVYRKMSGGKLKEDVVIKIIYEEYDDTILKGSKIVKRKYYPEMECDPNTLYCLRYWKPFYVMSDGTVIEYAHELYGKHK